MMPKFPSGTIVSTHGALETFNNAFLFSSLQRHLAGDWGNVCESDARSNNRAINFEERILSAYEQDGAKLWIITEADRSSTCLLLPDEY